MIRGALEWSAPGCATPSSHTAALGQIPSQVSCSSRKPFEVFIDTLALLLECVEHLIKPLLHFLHAAPRPSTVLMLILMP
jgi:hypothetical protein